MEARTWARHPDTGLAWLALGVSIFFWLVFTGLGALYWASLGEPPRQPVPELAARPPTGDFTECGHPTRAVSPHGGHYMVPNCWLDHRAYDAAHQAVVFEVDARNDAAQQVYLDQLQARWVAGWVVVLGPIGLLLVPLACLFWVRRTRPHPVVLEPRRLRIGSEAYLLEDDEQTSGALARLLAFELDEDLTEAIQRAHSGLRGAQLPSAADRAALEGLRA